MSHTERIRQHRTIWETSKFTSTGISAGLKSPTYQLRNYQIEKPPEIRIVDSSDGLHFNNNRVEVKKDSIVRRNSRSRSPSTVRAAKTPKMAQLPYPTLTTMKHYMLPVSTKPKPKPAKERRDIPSTFVHNRKPPETNGGSLFNLTPELFINRNKHRFVSPERPSSTSPTASHNSRDRRTFMTAVDTSAESIAHQEEKRGISDHHIHQFRVERTMDVSLFVDSHTTNTAHPPNGTAENSNSNKTPEKQRATTIPSSDIPRSESPCIDTMMLSTNEERGLAARAMLENLGTLQEERQLPSSAKPESKQVSDTKTNPTVSNRLHRRLSQQRPQQLSGRSMQPVPALTPTKPKIGSRQRATASPAASKPRKKVTINPLQQVLGRLHGSSLDHTLPRSPSSRRYHQSKDVDNSSDEEHSVANEQTKSVAKLEVDIESTQFLSPKPSPRVKAAVLSTTMEPSSNIFHLTSPSRYSLDLTEDRTVSPVDIFKTSNLRTPESAHASNANNTLLPIPQRERWVRYIDSPAFLHDSHLRHERFQKKAVFSRLRRMLSRNTRSWHFFQISHKHQRYVHDIRRQKCLFHRWLCLTRQRLEQHHRWQRISESVLYSADGASSSVDGFSVYTDKCQARKMMRRWRHLAQSRTIRRMHHFSDEDKLLRFKLRQLWRRWRSICGRFQQQAKIATTTDAPQRLTPVEDQQSSDGDLVVGDQITTPQGLACADGSEFAPFHAREIHAEDDGAEIETGDLDEQPMSQPRDVDNAFERDEIGCEVSLAGGDEEDSGGREAASSSSSEPQLYFLDLSVASRTPSPSSPSPPTYAALVMESEMPTPSLIDSVCDERVTSAQFICAEDSPSEPWDPDLDHCPPPAIPTKIGTAWQRLESISPVQVAQRSAAEEVQQWLEKTGGSIPLQQHSEGSWQSLSEMQFPVSRTAKTHSLVHTQSSLVQHKPKHMTTMFGQLLTQNPTTRGFVAPVNNNFIAPATSLSEAQATVPSMPSISGTRPQEESKDVGVRGDSVEKEVSDDEELDETEDVFACNLMDSPVAAAQWLSTPVTTPIQMTPLNLVGSEEGLLTPLVESPADTTSPCAPLTSETIPSAQSQMEPHHLSLAAALVAEANDHDGMRKNESCASFPHSLDPEIHDPPLNIASNLIQASVTLKETVLNYSYDFDDNHGCAEERKSINKEATNDDCVAESTQEKVLQVPEMSCSPLESASPSLPSCLTTTRAEDIHVVHFEQHMQPPASLSSSASSSSSPSSAASSPVDTSASTPVVMITATTVIGEQPWHEVLFVPFPPQEEEDVMKEENIEAQQDQRKEVDTYISHREGFLPESLRVELEAEEEEELYPLPSEPPSPLPDAHDTSHLTTHPSHFLSYGADTGHMDQHDDESDQLLDAYNSVDVSVLSPLRDKVEFPPSDNVTMLDRLLHRLQDNSLHSHPPPPRSAGATVHDAENEEEEMEDDFERDIDTTEVAFEVEDRSDSKGRFLDTVLVNATSSSPTSSAAYDDYASDAFEVIDDENACHLDDGDVGEQKNQRETDDLHHEDVSTCNAFGANSLSGNRPFVDEIVEADVEDEHGSVGSNVVERIEGFSLSAIDQSDQLYTLSSYPDDPPAAHVVHTTFSPPAARAGDDEDTYADYSSSVQSQFDPSHLPTTYFPSQQHSPPHEQHLQYPPHAQVDLHEMYQDNPHDEQDAREIQWTQEPPQLTSAESASSTITSSPSATAVTVLESDRDPMALHAQFGASRAHDSSDHASYASDVDAGEIEGDDRATLVSFHHSDISHLTGDDGDDDVDEDGDDVGDAVDDEYRHAAAYLHDHHDSDEDHASYATNAQASAPETDPLPQLMSQHSLHGHDMDRPMDKDVVDEDTIHVDIDLSSVAKYGGMDDEDGHESRAEEKHLNQDDEKDDSADQEASSMLLAQYNTDEDDEEGDAAGHRADPVVVDLSHNSHSLNNTEILESTALSYMESWGGQNRRDMSPVDHDGYEDDVRIQVNSKEGRDPNQDLHQDANLYEDVFEEDNQYREGEDGDEDDYSDDFHSYDDSHDHVLAEEEGIALPSNEALVRDSIEVEVEVESSIAETQDYETYDEASYTPAHNVTAIGDMDPHQASPSTSPAEKTMDADGDIRVDLDEDDHETYDRPPFPSSPTSPPQSVEVLSNPDDDEHRGELPQRDEELLRQEPFVDYDDRDIPVPAIEEDYQEDASNVLVIDLDDHGGEHDEESRHGTNDQEILHQIYTSSPRQHPVSVMLDEEHTSDEPGELEDDDDDNDGDNEDYDDLFVPSSRHTTTAAAAKTASSAEKYLQHMQRQHSMQLAIDHHRRLSLLRAIYRWTQRLLLQRTVQQQMLSLVDAYAVRDQLQLHKLWRRWRQRVASSHVQKTPWTSEDGNVVDI